MNSKIENRKILRIKTILRKILRISMILRIRIFVNTKILVLRIFLRKTTILKKNKNETNSVNKNFCEYRTWTPRYNNLSLKHPMTFSGVTFFRPWILKLADCLGTVVPQSPLRRGGD